MITKIYTVILVVSLLYMWINSPVDQGTKIVLSGISFGVFVWTMWLDTLFSLGIRSICSVPKLALIFGKSKKGSTLLAIAGLSIVFWWSPFAVEPSPYRLEMTICLISSIILLWLQPPAVLILGVSSQETANLVSQISKTIHPLRIVGLFDTKRTGRLMGTFSLFTDNMRTESDREWEKVVELILYVVPLVVIDTRTISPPVIREVKRVMGNNQYRKKSLFVVGSDNKAPALEASGYTVKSIPENIVTKDGLTHKRFFQIFRKF